MTSVIVKSLMVAFTVYFMTILHQAEGSDSKNDSISAILEIPDEVEEKMVREKLAPKCRNFLQNVLNGKWVPKTVPYNLDPSTRRKKLRELDELEQKLNEDMKFVWKKRGIPPDPWSSTRSCGYYRLRRATQLRPSIGTWCDPEGPRPCCTNNLFGKCVSARLGTCNCDKCVDVRTMKHAELMQWQPNGHRCKFNEYSPSEACAVLETSPVKELYIVGDSYLQDMYVAMLMVLSGKTLTGSWTKQPMTESQLESCSTYGFTYFKECRAMISSLDDMLYRDRLCGDGRNVTFKVEYKKYYSDKFGNEFKEFVRSLLGRKGAYVVVGIGFHVQMSLDKAIQGFLDPAIQLVNKFYRNAIYTPQNQRWPQFLFSYPMDYGILKPTRHLRAQHITKQIAFEKGMSAYCKRNFIETLDFTPLAKDVLTFDGVHYGVGVNIAKSQILLNYLATLPSIEE